jgi:amino acid permease
MVICCALIIPLALARNLNKLRYASIVAIFAIIYIAIVILFEFGWFAQVNNFSDAVIFNIDINIFNAFALSLFSFVCHTNLIKIYSELAKRNVPHMFKIIDRAIIVELFFYGLIAIFGYLSFLDDTPAIAALRDPPSNIGNDAAMVIG